MSLLIKGMTMPKDVTLLAISPDGTVDIISGQPDLSWKTLEHKAISVPPHGKLGDLDALIAVYERQIERHKEQAEKATMKGTGYTNDMYIIDRNRDIISALKAAPTIIQAEENDRSVIYCKECRVVQTCPCQKEKDERAGNPFKEVMGCNKGIPTIIPAEEGE